MAKFFSEQETRRWVSFFLLLQISGLIIFVVALCTVNEYVDKHGWIDAYFLLYSPLAFVVALFSKPSYFSPAIFLYWVSPLILIYPYSLILGGLAAYIRRFFRRR